MSIELPRPAPLESAVLYTHSESIWSSVALLAVYELGFENVILNETVNIDRGEHYTVWYLRLNPAGTVPTLVVPPGSQLLTGQTSQIVLRDSKEIVEFLISSSAKDVSPIAPEASAVTTDSESAATSERIIALLRDPDGPDPRFLKRSPRDGTEFSRVAEDLASVHRLRQESLFRSLAELQTADGQTNDELLQVVNNKISRNARLLQLWTNDDPRRTDEYMTSASSLWAKVLPSALQELEAIVVGPFCCGREVSAADFNLTAWLARVIYASGGAADGDAFVTVETKIGSSFRVGFKVRGFWDAMRRRSSFKHVYGCGLH